MYGIFTYISPKCMVNVGKYPIHGAYYNTGPICFPFFLWNHKKFKGWPLAERNTRKTIPIPNTQCVVHLPTFTTKTTQM